MNYDEKYEMVQDFVNRIQKIDDLCIIRDLLVMADGSRNSDDRKIVQLAISALEDKIDSSRLF